MQIEKVKSGYKILRGKPSFVQFVIPEEWKLSSLGKIGKYINGMAFQPKYWKNYGIPIIRIQNLTDVNNEFNYYDGPVDTIYEINNDDILISWSATLGVYRWNRGKAYLNQHIFKAIPNSDVDADFFFYAVSHQIEKMKNMIHGTTMQHITKKPFLETSIPLPPFKEQQKIGSIILNIDSLIQQTQKIIEQTQRLKKGLIQKLLIKGIGHTAFKFENTGKRFLNVEIPKTWNMKKFMDIITVRDNYIELDDDTEYTRIIVKRRHEGIILRDIVKGKGILTKNQYQVRSGDFVVSRRQIIHNACGLIPNEFDGAVVSNEYSLFSGSKYLDIDYFDWFSQTDLFKKTIIVTTHGVDVEKYVFLLDEWLKLKMPLPSISEQKKIVEILSNIENKLTKEQKYKSYLESLKKGMMQKLLTGQIRVKG